MQRQIRYLSLMYVIGCLRKASIVQGPQDGPLNKTKSVITKGSSFCSRLAFSKFIVAMLKFST